MFESVRRFFDSGSLSPHGICLLWRPELIWTHVVSDALIGAAYFSIPPVLAWFAYKRRDVAFGWMFWCFAAFILACGSTHFFAIWTLWRPDYASEALVKAATAAISMATAITLWPLLPRALALPSPAQLRQANAELSARIEERDAALVALRRETDERRRVEDVLRQSQKMEAVGQLTGGVAHDFNNLLTVIVANIDRANRLGPKDEARRSEALAQALAGAQRAAALTDRLLAFARKQPLQPSRQNLCALVEGLSPLIAQTLPRQIRLETDLPSDLSPVMVDANQFENALLNLVVNARDAMPDGGVLAIAASQERDPSGDRVVVTVADTGRGMDEATRERAFEPFFTTKPLGQGTGLGLSQVYGFASQSGGGAEIASRPGEGARVRIWFPALSDDREGAAA